MTLENINYIAQTIAAVAIVASLVILIVQVRQTQADLRRVAFHTQLDGLRQLVRGVYETPGLADILARSRTAWETLNPEERVRLEAYYLESCRIWEGLHALHASGLIDEPTWTAHLPQFRTEMAEPGVARFWSAVRHMFTPAFQAFFDAQTVIAIAERAEAMVRRKQMRLGEVPGP